MVGQNVWISVEGFYMEWVYVQRSERCMEDDIMSPGKHRLPTKWCSKVPLVSELLTPGLVCAMDQINKFIHKFNFIGFNWILGLKLKDRAVQWERRHN